MRKDRVWDGVLAQGVYHIYIDAPVLLIDGTYSALTLPSS